MKRKLHFCLKPTAEVPINKLSCCCCSGHLVNLLLGCTSGLNLAAYLPRTSPGLVDAKTSTLVSNQRHSVVNLKR